MFLTKKDLEEQAAYIYRHNIRTIESHVLFEIFYLILHLFRISRIICDADIILQLTILCAYMVIKQEMKYIR